MASVASLLPQRLRELITPHPTSIGVGGIRRSAPNAPIPPRNLLNSGSATKSQRLANRVFFKNNSWDAPADKSIDEEIAVPRVLFKNNSCDAPADESIDEETAVLLDNYEALFHEADADNDGLLHRAELRTILERVGGESSPLHWLTSEDVDHIFDQYDLDRDKAINLIEFMALAHDNVFLTRALSEYRTAFRAVDKNGDGFLGPTEIISVLHKVGSPLSSYEHIVRLMDKYDTDHNGRMDFGEFLRLCRYEDTLPLDDILKYAAAHNHPSSSGTTTAHNQSATNATSLASESTSTSTTTTPKPAGGAAARMAEQRAKNEQLVISIANEEAFNGIFECNKDKLVVVMGSLSWCRPCKRMAPVFQRMAAAYPQAVFLHLNGNDSAETKELFKHKLKMRATPAFLFFKEGVVVDSCSGANPARFESHLRRLLPAEDMPKKSLYELIDIENDKDEGEKTNILGF